MNRSIRSLPAAALAVLIAGCGSLPPDHGRSTVAALLEARGIDASALPDPSTGTADGPVRPMLSGPLTLETATHLALVNNPGLQARLAELGFAAADVYDAGRLSNPRLDLGYLFVERGNLQNEKSVGLTQNFTELILLPARRRLAEGEFERVRQATGGAVQDLAADVAHAWYALAGATETAALARQSADTARLSAELAERYFAAGNINRRERAEAGATAANARLDALQAELAAADARAALARLIGTALPPDLEQLTAGLPPPETALPDRSSLLALADSGRLDLAAARQGVAVRADAVGVTRQFRYLGTIEAGPKWEWDDSGMRSFGPKVSAELPLFNRGAGKVARAEAELALAEATLARLEIEIVTEVDRTAVALATARARFDVYHDQLLPTHREIVARRQEALNFMLEGPFVLLEAKQDEYRAAAGMLDAARDYWLSRVALARAVGQPPPAPETLAETWLTASSLTGTDAASAGDEAGTHDHSSPAPEPADAEGEADHQHHHGAH
jgi:outer membrane protein, heavy metal efflux system